MLGEVRLQPASTESKSVEFVLDFRKKSLGSWVLDASFSLAYTGTAKKILLNGQFVFKRKR